MWQLLASLAQKLPAEAAHKLAVEALRLNIVPSQAFYSSKVDLGVTLAGIHFSNPLGLAAGFDKNASCFEGALRLGFGHVEVGTVTPLPQTGNPKPRVFRLANDNAIINRYGFNSKGMHVAGCNLKRRKSNSGIVGVNIGANKTSIDKIADYQTAVTNLAGVADYLTVNISSPNTPGLRDLQTANQLKAVLLAAHAGLADGNLKKPLFLKIAPDLHERDLALLVDIAVQYAVSAIVVTNTTISRPPGLLSHNSLESGGLSGAPLFVLSTNILERVAHYNQSRIGLIGVGGIVSGWQAYAKILVGANLVQLYTGLALQGPKLPVQILQQLANLMEFEGVSSIRDFRGQIPNAKKAIHHALQLSKSCPSNEENYRNINTVNER